MGTQEKLSHELYEYARKLEDRLAPIIHATGPAEIREDVQEELVPLANKLRENNQRIVAAVRVLNSILERLEL
jgi:hypothetical protein